MKLWRLTSELSKKRGLDSSLRCTRHPVPLNNPCREVTSLHTPSLTHEPPTIHRGSEHEVALFHHSQHSSIFLLPARFPVRLLTLAVIQLLTRSGPTALTGTRRVKPAARLTCLTSLRTSFSNLTLHPRSTRHCCSGHWYILGKLRSIFV